MCENMTKQKIMQNQLLWIAILALIGTLVLFGSSFLSVVGESIAFTNTVTSQVSIDPANPLVKTYKTATPPYKSGDFVFELQDTTDPNRVCTTNNICFTNGERKTIVPFIDVQMISRGLTEEDDQTYTIDFLFFIDADNAMDISSQTKTGVQHNSDFNAPVMVTSKFSQKMNIGVISESRSLLLEGASKGQILDPQLIETGGSATFPMPVDTTILGFNEAKTKPYIRFSREDRFVDVGTTKVLLINFRISPLIQGQELPEGSIGTNLDPDSPVQRVFVQPVQAVKDQAVGASFYQILFVLFIVSVIGVLLIQIYQKRR